MRSVRNYARASWALASLLLAAPAAAAAQERLVLPQGPIGEVVSAQQLREQQFDALIGNYRQQLQIELNFVQRACDLSPEQVAVLQSHGEEIVRGAREQFADAMAPQPAGQRVVIVNNRRLLVVGNRIVAVAGDAQPAETAALEVAMHDHVDAAVRKTLPDHVAARLTEERRQIAEKARQAKIDALVAAMDELLLLSDKQRAEVRELLDSQWNEAWTAVATGIDRPLTTPAQARGVTLLAKSRGLGGAFDLGNNLLDAVLRPAQMAVWKDLRKPLNFPIAGMAVVAPAAAMANGQLLQGVVRVRHAQLRGVIRLEPPGQAQRLIVPPQPAQIAAKAQRKAEAVERENQIVQPSAEQAAYLELLLDTLADCCELSPSLREKLFWAGQLDLRSYAQRADTIKTKLHDRPGDALGEAETRRLIESLAPSDLLADEASLFSKTAGCRMPPEQWERWMKNRRTRLEFQQQARLELIVLRFSQSSPLTTAQWDALGRLIGDRLAALPADASARTLTAGLYAAVAAIPEEQLRALFDEVQWPAASRQLETLRQIAIQFNR